MFRRWLAAFGVLLVAGCLPPMFPDGPSGTRPTPAFEPHTAYVEALVAEAPEVLAPFVRREIAGAVVVGADSVPPMAQYVTTLRPDPAGTRLRIARRPTQREFYDGTQLLYLFRKVVGAWSGQEDGYIPPHLARIVPQASAPTCMTDSSNGGLPAPLARNDPEVWNIVDEPPQLIGGLSGLQKSVSYPELARRAGAEGVVLVQFVVDEEGRVPCADVVVGLPFGMNQNVLEAVRAARFTPGRVDGEAVKVRFSLPVKFRLR